MKRIWEHEKKKMKEKRQANKGDKTWISGNVE